MRSNITLITYFVAAAGFATASAKRRPASYEDSFTRPKETGIVVDNYVLQDVSPAVTDAPIAPRYGLMERQNTFGRGPDTCAFFADGLPLRCYSRDATCIHASPFAGCCTLSESCSSIPTTCIHYTDVLKGSCDPQKVTDPQTACCERLAPYCVLHSIDMGNSRVSIWGCSEGIQGALLLTTNPAIAPDGSTTGTITHTDSAITDNGATPVAPSPKGINTDGATQGGDDGSSTNIGAIAGGAVGGVAGLALIGAAIFLYMRHKKKKVAAAGGIAAAPMAQQPGQGPPANVGYNSGQPDYQHHYGAYDPKAYPQQQVSPGPYTPSAYSPDYTQQQQPSWGHPSPSATNTSPAPANSEPVATELPDGRPTGSRENRAELG